MKTEPIQQELNERLEYCNYTGVFRWKAKPAHSWIEDSWNTQNAGQVAGYNRPNGYTYIGWQGRAYGAHRLAWIITNGTIGEGLVIDHIDGDPSNNAIENLRATTQQNNRANSKVNNRNIAGVKNVHAKPNGTFQVQIWSGGKRYCCGSYATLEEAAKQAEVARAKHHGAFARSA